jgi:hypothetical protein
MPAGTAARKTPVRRDLPLMATASGVPVRVDASDFKEGTKRGGRLVACWTMQGGLHGYLQERKLRPWRSMPGLVPDGAVTKETIDSDGDGMLAADLAEPIRRGQQPAKSRAEIRAIVDRVRFMDRTFRLMRKGDGFLLQLVYKEPDVDDPDGTPVVQQARKWYVSPFATESEIVETAYAACLRSMTHVVREHFTYEGRRIFSPHFDVRARLAMVDQGAFDRRK